MPVDASNVASSLREQQRRQQRGVPEAPTHGEGSHAREIELKRSRGEISCAECRRLKIKCDKKLPCSSCLRRGCASLCPNGSLATGQGTRFVLAATDHLHRRIALMSTRIRQLEDALAVLQSSCSKEPHPLLRDELLSLKLDHDELSYGDDELGQESSEVMDSFGTLTLSDSGTSRFFGSSGGTELLLLNEDDPGGPPSTFSSPSVSGAAPGSATSPSSRTSHSPSLPPSITACATIFPFSLQNASIGGGGAAGALAIQRQQQLIETHLPPRARGFELAETYLEGAGWLFHPVSPEQLLQEMLPAVYDRVEARRKREARRAAEGDGHDELPQENYSPGPYASPHALAVVFGVLAIGALVDMEQKPFGAEAERYYTLARATVCLQSVFEHPELVTVQALHLMSIFNAMNQPDGAAGSSNGGSIGSDGGGGRDAIQEAETSMEMSWSLIRLCHQLAQSMGLHRDSARWGLGPLEVQRRRALFWDLFVGDSWQALSTGRPPSIMLPYIDAQYPQDKEATLSTTGQEEPGFGSWGFRFASECVAEVAAKTSMAQIPPYSTILTLDRKVRDFYTPEIPLPRDAAGNVDRSKASLIMTRYVLAHSREVILLCLHRSFFAQAMVDDPVNPLRSQYAPSYLAAYRSAAHILASIKEQVELLPGLCARFWSTWTYAFSAAVVFGTIVTRGPGSSMAHAALEELDGACALFMRASNHSRRAFRAMIILQKLQTKAHIALESLTPPAPNAPLAPSVGEPPPMAMLTPTLAPSSSGAHVPPKEEQTDVHGDDELAIFGGRARVLSPKRVSPQPSAAAASASTSALARGSSLVGGFGGMERTLSGATSASAASGSSAGWSGAGAGGSSGGSVSSSSVSPAPLPPAEYGYDRGLPAWAFAPPPPLPAISGPGASAGMGGSGREYRGGFDRRAYEQASFGYPQHARAPSHSQVQSQGQQTSRHDWDTPEAEAVAQGYFGGGAGFSSQPSHGEVQYPPSVSVSVDFGGYPQPHPQHGQPHPQPHTPHAYGPGAYQPDGYSTPTSPYGPGGIPAAAPPPRELAAIGLASAHSGLDRRWTNFMQESGVFYGGGT